MSGQQHQKPKETSTKEKLAKVKSSTATPKGASDSSKSKIASSSVSSLSSSSSTSVSSQKTPPMPPVFTSQNFLAGVKPKVSDFEMIKTVGTGTFGVIKVAKHISTGKCVAIKILNKQKIWDMKQVEHLKNEKNILFMVPHPRIVNLYATMQDVENIYLVMEYISGGEIFSHLRQRQTFDMETTKYYIAQLVTAIAELHSKGTFKFIII
jgi:protein kinase A